MATGKRFDGKLFFPAGWFYQKTAAQGNAKWYRDRGYYVRVVRERNLPAYMKGGKMGYGVYAFGMQGRRAK